MITGNLQNQHLLPALIWTSMNAPVVLDILRKEMRNETLCAKFQADQQLCEFIDGLSISHPNVEDFFRCLDKQAGSGSGISTGTIHKLRRIAIKEGFLEG